MSEQRYRFFDKTGHCFTDFGRIGDCRLTLGYHKTLGARLRDSKETFEAWEAFRIRDNLTEDGFEWGKDFYMRKVK